MLKYLIFILTFSASLAQAMNPANPKIDAALAQCMQNHEHMNDRMACARITFTLKLNEKASEQNESDSECVKTCKKDIAAAIARERSSKPEEETLFPAGKLLLSEKRAKLLKEQFLQCLKACDH